MITLAMDIIRCWLNQMELTFKKQLLLLVLMVLLLGLILEMEIGLLKVVILKRILMCIVDSMII